MLLSQTASSPPNFILIGAGLVWQTLPAGWVHTFESHYKRLFYAPLAIINKLSYLRMTFLKLGLHNTWHNWHKWKSL